MLNLTDAETAVRDFHRVMIGPQVTPETPIPLEDYDGELRCSLIEEEAAEFREAWSERDRLAMIDALCDLLYVTIGAAVQMGVELAPFFREVHEANMKKTGGRLRADGKQLKPPDWKPPNIAALYHRLYEEPT